MSENKHKEFALALHDLFVNRHDNYAVQRRNGQYFRVEKPLTLEVLQQHLEGKVTVGAYQLDAESMVKTLIFDLDLGKLEDPEATARTIVEECVSKPEPKKPRFYWKAVLLEASRYPDPSYHIWVFFQPVPVPAQMARWLGLKVLEHANINPKLVEVFPKQDTLTQARPFGNFVKLPLGKHQEHGKWSRFLDLETFEPLPPEVIFEAWGCSFSEADLTKIGKLAEKQHGVQTRISCDVSTDFKDLKSNEEKRIARFLTKYWKEGHRNELCMAFLGWAIKRGISFDSAFRIVDEVVKATDDEEQSQRLEQVKYHYQNRRSMGTSLLGISGLKEIVKEALK